MENFKNFAILLCPSQNRFIRKGTINLHEEIKNFQENQDDRRVTIMNGKIQRKSEDSPLTRIFKEPAEKTKMLWQNKYKISDFDKQKLDVVENGTSYNLYTCILCQLCQKYKMSINFEQQSELIDELQRLLISKLTLDFSIKKIIHETTIRPYTLINEIKNEHYQSPNVVWYLSLVFDLNIIILPTNIEKNVEIYFSDSNYDECKPHILLGRNDLNIYCSIIYDCLPLLTYHDHAIIRSMIEQHPTEYNFLTLKKSLM